MNPRETVIRVSHTDIPTQLRQVTAFLQDARYKQAIRVLNDAVASATSLDEQLLILAYRAFAYTLWRRLDHALNDVNQAIQSVTGDLPPLWEIDWNHEKKQDIGHLTFLGTLFNLRGILYRTHKEPERAVEDFTAALLMTSAHPLLQVNFLHRACTLIAMGECLTRAQTDLEQALTINRASTLEWFNLNDMPNGEFIIKDKHIYFSGSGKSIGVDSRYLELATEWLTPDLFTFYQHHVHGQMG